MIACGCKHRRSVKAERFLLLETGGGAVLMKAADSQGQSVALNGSTEDVDEQLVRLRRKPKNEIG